MTEIASSVRQLAGVGRMDNVKYVVCEVISVSEESRTCNATTVSDAGEMTLEGINLMAEIDDGIFALPAIGSTVIVSYSDKVAPFVVSWSEIQKMLTIVGNSGIEVTGDLIKFNDGAFGGLVKVIELTEKYNALVTLVNSFITMYNSHVHASNGTPTTQLQTNTAQSIVRSDIENQNIVHGESI